MTDAPPLASAFDEWRMSCFDVANCPARNVLNLVGDKWTMLVLIALAPGAHRFSRLHKSIPDISKNMLTQSLRELERDGMMERRVFATKPPTVEYALSPLGRSMLDPLAALVEWAERKYPEIRSSREDYDTRSDAPQAERVEHQA